MKIYYSEQYVTPSWRPYHTGDYSYYKQGNVGKSHSVVRLGYIRRAVYNPIGPFGTFMSSYHYNHKVDEWAYTRNEIALQHNRVLAKLEGKLGPSSAVGSSVFAEGRESVQMAVMALERAANLVKAIKRKDIRRLKKVWDKPMRPTTAMKKAGGGWLEFSFGWQPLVTTVCDAIAITGKPFPPVKVKASDRMSKLRKFKSGDYIYYSDTSQFLKAGFTVTVENPNTWLLGRLDLLNPVGWIWEAIPYSFFVDYFVNIGDMIHNLDSFAGLRMANGYSTYYHSWDESRTYTIGTKPNNNMKSSGYFLTRTDPISLNRVFAFATNPLTSSWRRGLNASSFLAQRLR